MLLCGVLYSELYPPALGSVGVVCGVGETCRV